MSSDGAALLTRGAGRPALALLLSAFLAAGAVLAGCVGCTSSAATSGPADSAPQSSAPPLRGDDPYAAAVRIAAHSGITVWIETDLARRWLDGSAAFRSAIARVTQLARLSGVRGIKIADELGYDDAFAGRPGRMRAFVRAVAAALRPQLPGRQLLVDLVVPQLGCLPGDNRPLAVDCRQTAAQLHPGLALTDIDALVATGAIDVVDLSTGLLTARRYAAMHSSPEAAQAAAWQEVLRRGWPRHIVLHARKALAHPGKLSDSADISSELRTYIDIPMQKGASAVDIWTWRQTYHGQIYHLTDPGGRPNELWDALRSRHAAGKVLFTHFTPSSVEVSVRSDLAEIATSFSAVFVAAGTG